MDIKLFDSELKVMDVLWKEGDTPAREIARVLTDELGWNVNTTYTLIKRCIKKGAIARSEPGGRKRNRAGRGGAEPAPTNAHTKASHYFERCILTPASSARALRRSLRWRRRLRRRPGRL